MREQGGRRLNVSGVLRHLGVSRSGSAHSTVLWKHTLLRPVFVHGSKAVPGTDTYTALPLWSDTSSTRHGFSLHLLQFPVPERI